MIEISLNNLKKSFGFKNILDGLNIEIKTGDRVSIIGENGCGKSSILEAVFEKYIEDEQIRTICFSSGQNELFTNLFYRHKQRNRRYLQKEENQYISSFYFNYDWVRVLVFFASVLKPNGKVREFLVSRGYIDVNGEDDVSSKLYFPFRIRKYYKARIDNEILEEAKPDFDFETKLVRKSYFHEILVRLLSVYNITFEFGDDKYQTLFKI